MVLPILVHPFQSIILLAPSPRILPQSQDAACAHIKAEVSSAALIPALGTEPNVGKTTFFHPLCNRRSVLLQTAAPFSSCTATARIPPSFWMGSPAPLFLCQMGCWVQVATSRCIITQACSPTSSKELLQNSTLWLLSLVAQLKLLCTVFTEKQPHAGNTFPSLDPRCFSFG